MKYLQLDWAPIAEVTDISGRGVGLDVVKNYIIEQGGHVAWPPEQETQSGYLPFKLDIHLPPSMYLIEHSHKGQKRRHND